MSLITSLKTKGETEDVARLSKDLDWLLHARAFEDVLIDEEELTYALDNSFDLRGDQAYLFDPGPAFDQGFKAEKYRPDTDLVKPRINPISTASAKRPRRLENELKEATRAAKDDTKKRGSSNQQAGKTEDDGASLPSARAPEPKTTNPDQDSLGPVALPEPYASIAEAARQSGRLSAQAQLEASEHEIDDLKQTLFPQITPGASLDSNGDTIASANVDQVVFDSGRYSANKKVLLGERDAVSANLQIDESAKISNAISAYIEFHHAQASQQVMASVVTLYSDFQKIAERRLLDGLGDASVRDLFNLRVLETQALRDNFANDARTAEKKFRALAKIDLPPQKPPRLRLKLQLDQAPQVTLAAAERDTADSQLKFDKADRLPRLAVVGNVGIATDSFDEESLDLRIQLQMNQPINWGLNSALASSRSRLEAFQLAFDEAVKQVRDEATILELDIAQAEARLVRLEKVLVAAKKRLDSFDDQFLAGQSSLNEVASIIDTFRSTQLMQVDDTFGIHNMELEFANLTGALASRSNQR